MAFAPTTYLYSSSTIGGLNPELPPAWVGNGGCRRQVVGTPFCGSPVIRPCIATPHTLGHVKPTKWVDNQQGNSSSKVQKQPQADARANPALTEVTPQRRLTDPEVVRTVRKCFNPSPCRHGSDATPTPNRFQVGPKCILYCAVKSISPSLVQLNSYKTTIHVTVSICQRNMFRVI